MAIIIRAPKPWAPDEKFTILENPTKDEYESFVSNTNYRAVRGVLVDGNIFISDADVGTHNNILKTLENLGKIKGHLQAAFQEEANGEFTYCGKKTHKVKKVLGHKIKNQRQATEKINYFSLEYIYTTICQNGYAHAAKGLNEKYSEYKLNFKDFLPGHKYHCNNFSLFKAKVKSLIDKV